MACPSYTQRWRKVLDAARAVDAGSLAKKFAETPSCIPNVIHVARVAAVAAALKDEAVARSNDLLSNFEQ